jgi:FKBP-type peptidyl-prolyl cis-trans isomerase
MGVLYGANTDRLRSNLKIEFNIDYDLFLAGFKDALTKADSLKPDMYWADGVFKSYIDGKVREIEAKVREKSLAYLDENRKKDSVVVLESGLQYKVITEGSGKSPLPADTINVKYKGTTVEGQVFDMSPEPVKFPLSGMIPGWIEGIPLMKEGAKYMFFIPPHLAYGDSGRMGGQTLIFEVELVSVIRGKEQEKNKK